MSKSANGSTSAKAAGGYPPSKEAVLDWIKKDTQAAAYFLILLSKYPDVLERIAEDLYEKAMQEKRDKELLDKEV